MIVQWPNGLALPQAGSIVDAGILGKAYVVKIETPQRFVYFSETAAPSKPDALCAMGAKVTFAVFQPSDSPPPKE